MTNETSDIASKIKKIRKLKNMTQEDLSSASGINISTIKKYETGIRIPKREQLAKIADALGVNVNDFYERDIKTVGEILSTLISLEENTNLKISFEKDNNGNYIPESIKFNFDDEYINNYLIAYLMLKDARKNMHREKLESSDELDKLLMEDTPIKKKPKKSDGGK